MALQKQINSALAAGVAGDRANLNPAVYTETNFLAGDDGVTVGGFVWNSNGSAVSTGTGAPLGFVERNVSYYNYDVRADGTLRVGAGSPLTIAKRGDFFAKADTAAVVGQLVLAKTADGSVTTGAAAGAGNVETGFKVATAAAAGETFIISGW